MGIYRSDITGLRKSIGENIGQKIIVKESPGKRSKPQEKLAVIENTYKDYFRVRFQDVERSGSYNYTDLFTRTVEVRMFNDETEEFEPIISPQIPTRKHRTQVTTAIETNGIVTERLL